MKTMIITAAFLFTFHAAVSAVCPGMEQDAFVAYADSAVMQYLQTLKESDKGKSMDAFMLCDSARPLQGLTFRGRLMGTPRHTHVYLFNKSDSLESPGKARQVALLWVTEKGSALSIPKCRDDCTDANAYSINGDAFEEPRIQPTGEIVIVSYPTQAWLNSLTK